MPLSVSFNWRSPNVQVSNQSQRDMVEGVKAIGQGIAQARDRRFQREQAAYQKEQTERRNRIEDEDRSRRMSEEDRRKQVYGEAADLMRRRELQLAGLKDQRNKIVMEIEQLRREIGTDG